MPDDKMCRQEYLRRNVTHYFLFLLRRSFELLRRSCELIPVVTIVFLITLSISCYAQTPSDCYACHDDKEKTFTASVHGSQDCIDCHADLKKSAFPHKEKVDPVNCGTCHADIEKIYRASLHGKLVTSGAKLAPRCWDCHGSHDISSVKSPTSKVFKFKVPFTCGRCHKEGTAVTKTYDIPQDKILEHYSESIHGLGLFKKGLLTTAVCSDCHTSHNVLPHTDPASSINRNNIQKTCRQCHGMIETVHRKIIRGELWEKEPNKIPICIDCHSPHQVRKIQYDQQVADQDCLTCHGKPDLSMVRGTKTVSLYVKHDELQGSSHKKIACAQCHNQVTPGLARPCETAPAAVDCSICHEEPMRRYAGSVHGRLHGRGDPAAPTCLDCHGKHGIKGKRDPASASYPLQIPRLCGQCHRKGQKAAIRYTGKETEAVAHYEESVHGKGLSESGLVVTATCADCHRSHDIMASADPGSSVNRENIAVTCAKCHNGIYEKFRNSIHSAAVSKSDKPLPMCNDCHSSHSIARTGADGFRLTVLDQCGKCHHYEVSSYFDTFHGKVSKLGYGATAKCQDCHGAHDILPQYFPASRLSRKNIVLTCGKCHPGSHLGFTRYLTHATYNDRHKYPILYYSFWFMTSLLLGTFLFFGIHTLFWLPRSFRLMKERRSRPVHHGERSVVRFSPLERFLHVLVIVSFIGLALTGMSLKFSNLAWAQWLSHLLGGFTSAGYIHRFCALITFGYFGTHVVDLFRKKARSGKSWFRFLLGPDSMVPNWNDLKEFIATYRWFLGLGPRPAYGRWTYWEKFDYFAVFWGVMIIGSTGMVLWFPEIFTRLFPGWAINVATIVHSDEALLAVGFIFTIHFFNTHLRPDRFPMDTVIFTGRVPLEEFKEERPREYEEMVKAGKLEQSLIDPLPPYLVRVIKVFGAAAVVTGTLLVLFIIWAELGGR